MDTIDQLRHNLNAHNGEELESLLSNLNNSRNVATLPLLTNDVDEFKPIINSYIQLNKSSLSYNVLEIFNVTMELLKALNRYAESQTNWVVRPLIAVTKRLIKIATQADEFLEKNPNLTQDNNNDSNPYDFELESCLIKSARIVHNSFKLCLNDRNEDPRLSRRSQIFYFVGQELKIYFQLQNKQLAKNMEKVLISKKAELPDLEQISKSQSITYLYFSGGIFCGDGDFNTAFLKFKQAFQYCNKNDYKHSESILIYLIPLKFLITKKYPNLLFLKKNYPNVFNLYTDLIISLLNGDLLRFEQFLDKYETFFLKKNLYLVIEKLRAFVLLKLFKRIYIENKRSSHLPIPLVTKGLELSKFHKVSNSLSNDETECLLSNLIYKGFVKGYLSHSNGVLVLSKKDPFPLQLVIDEK